MLIDFPSPVLNVASDVLKDLDGADALTGLWFIFTKCKSSLNEGRRLENISWRLWYREMAARPSRYRPLTPDTPAELANVHTAETSTALLKAGHLSSSPRPPIGKVIYEMLPNFSPQANAKFRLPNGTTRLELEVTSNTSLLPSPAAELLSISIIPPARGSISSFTPAALSTPHNMSHNHSSSSVTSATSTPATVVSHASPPPPQSSLSSSNSGTGTLSSPFPLVVVVNPTPNPTPHPTPPATPVIPPTVTLGSDARGHTHVQLPSPQQIRHPARLLLPPAIQKRPRSDSSLSQAQSLHHSDVNGPRPSSELSFSPASPGRSSTPSLIPDALLPPSPSTSNSITSNSPISASPLTTASENSHTTLSTTTSTTSVNSGHAHSPDATLKPQDARKFFLQRSREGDLSSQSSGSQSSTRNDTLVMTKVRPDSRSTSSHTTRPQNRSAATVTESGLDHRIGGVEARGTGYMTGKPRVSRQPSEGQSSNSAMSNSWSDGESDDADGRQHLVMQTRKTRRSGSSSTRSTQSRSCSRGRSTHDGLIMSRGRKRAVGGGSSGGNHRHGASHHAHTVGRKGGRIAAAMHAQGHTTHGHGHGAAQTHGSTGGEGEGTRAHSQGQGHVQKRVSHSRENSLHADPGHAPASTLVLALGGSTTAGSGSISTLALASGSGTSNLTNNNNNNNNNNNKVESPEYGLVKRERERELTARPTQAQMAQIQSIQQAPHPHLQPQMSSQGVVGLTPGHKRPTFNIGSNSTGSASTESPSNTDLSKSSELRGGRDGVGDSRGGGMLPLALARAQTQAQLALGTGMGKGREWEGAPPRQAVGQSSAFVPPPALSQAIQGQAKQPLLNHQPQQSAQVQANKASALAQPQPHGLPPATTNLAAAEAMIQAHHEKAQARPRKVVVATDEDDDDWDETETDTDVESDFEDESFVEEKGERGAGNVEEGEGEDSGEWISDDASGEVEVVAPKAESSKAAVAGGGGGGGSRKNGGGVQPPNGGPNGSLKRPGHARHTSQPNVPTVASITKQKQQQQLLAQQANANYTSRQHQQQQQPPAGPIVAPPIQQRFSRHGRSEREREREREARQQAFTDQKLREAALEAQRQREMFVKIPKRSYSNLSTRSKSGLLSQLMNPDPDIFPMNHPYRRGHSSGDVLVGGQVRVGIQPMTSIGGEVRGGISAAAPQPGGAGAAGPSRVAGAMGPPPKMPGGLKPSKSAVALPVANSVTASSFVDNAVVSTKGKERQREVSAGTGNGGGYRPKGRPDDQEMEDESETDDAGALQISKSAAQEKLAALAGRRNAGAAAKATVTGSGAGSGRTNSDSIVRQQQPPRPSSSRYDDPTPAPPVQRSQSQFIPGANVSTSTAPAPLPLGFPYNLPPAAPPSSPRTTRQLMLRTEMSESLRQNLLWHRQQSKAVMNGPRRVGGVFDGGGLKPLTTISAVPSLVHLTAKKKPGEPGQVTTVGGTNVGVKDEWDVDEKTSKMTRNRSWAGGGR